MELITNLYSSQQELKPSQIFLPFDFSAHILQPDGSKEDHLLVFGGGGNCFSFGSHYNTDSFLFKLPLVYHSSLHP